MSNARTLANFRPETLGGLATKSTVGSAEITNGSVTPADLAQPLTRSTAQATTSGTAVDFTSIPSWVKKITVVYSGVSLSGSSHTIVQLGSGSLQTTGYSCSAAYAGTTNSAGVATATNGLAVHGGSSTNLLTGVMTIINTTGNVWVAAHSGTLNTSLGVMGGGSVTLSGTLDRLRLTSVNGTDNFDAGSVTILYE